MPLIYVTLLLFATTVGPALAQTTMDSQLNRQHWDLCQSGDVEKCSRLLRLPLDSETRALVEADLEQARERQRVQVRALLQACSERVNVRACDRALRYNLSEPERREILDVRKAVIFRTSQPGTR